MSAVIERQEVARAVGVVMKDLVARATQPLIERIAALERRLSEVVFERGEPGPPGRDGVNGKDADESKIIARLTDALEERFADFVGSVTLPKDGAPGKDGKDGKDGQVHARDVMAAVIEYMEAHPIPVPKDGRDGRDGKDGRDGLNGVNGKDANALAVQDIEAAVESYLEAHPPAPGADGKPGADGRDGVDGRNGLDGADGVNGKDGADGRHGVDGKDGRDGTDGKSVSIDDVLPTVMEKVQKALDAIPIPKDGKDGEPGRDGKDGTSVTVEEMKAIVEAYASTWALDFEKRASEVMQRTIDRLPKPKDGRDALSIENFELSLGDDLRTFTVALICGETRVEKSVKLPFPVYREIWKAETSYDIGDAVTWDGSVWIALKASTGSRPGEYNKSWRLAVKRGRNGRDAKEPE